MSITHTILEFLIFYVHCLLVLVALRYIMNFQQLAENASVGSFHHSIMPKVVSLVEYDDLLVDKRS